MVSSYTSTTAPPHAPVNDSGLPAALPGMPGGGPPPPDRSLGRRSSLPAGRAIVGATLVVIAAVLTFVGYVLATAKPTQTYLVAVTRIEPNQPLSPSQFRAVNGDLPPEVQASIFRSFDQLKDQVLVTALPAGALAAKTNFVPGTAVGSRYNVPFTAAEAKLNGVKPGDTVLLVPTADRNGSAASDPLPVQIISLAPGRGSNGDWTVIAAANSTTDVKNLVGVVKGGDFWIARDTGSGTGAAPTGGTAGGSRNGPLSPTEAPTTTTPATTSAPTTAAPPPPSKKP
jgi:hypothetical protein